MFVARHINVIAFVEWLCETALWAVCPRLTEVRLQQQSTRGNFAFPALSKLFWNFVSLFVGISEPVPSYSFMFIKSLQIGLIGFLLCAASASAGPTSIQGIVKDAQGKPIKGADVRVESRDGKQLFNIVKTDAKGRYISQGLKAGVYRVRW